MTEFSPQSRYHGLAQHFLPGADGEDVPYLARRIIAAPTCYDFESRVRSDGAQRIDQLAAETIGDPLLYWRICDANGIERPERGTRPEGREIGIPLPLTRTGGGGG
ncbi:hypothetical protein [Novosphingobium profundi]|uniref:hypothetical protein n=1 Tax=Novosphingobium profundi TaxID=1774954 RepID=UPI001CFE47AE|nr:hypothetical protein [Novosphingobium profundi]